MTPIAFLNIAHGVLRAVKSIRAPLVFQGSNDCSSALERSPTGGGINQAA